MIGPVPGPPTQGAQLELRPSLWRYLQTHRAPAFMLALVAVVLFLRGGGLGVLLAVLIAAGGSSLVSLYFRRASVVVTPTELISTGLVRTRKAPRDDIAEVVAVAMPRSHRASRTFPHVFVLDHAGRRLARLRGTHWLVDDMRRVIKQVGIAPRKISGTTTAKDLAASHPAAVPLLERRPILRNLLVIVPGLALVAVVLTATD